MRTGFYSSEARKEAGYTGCFDAGTGLVWVFPWDGQTRLVLIGIKSRPRSRLFQIAGLGEPTYLPHLPCFFFFISFCYSQLPFVDHNRSLQYSPPIPQTHKPRAPKTMASAQDEYNELFRDKSHRTRHPDDDDDDAASFLESDSDGDNEATPRTSDVENHPPPTSRYQIPSYDRSNSGTTNTGPKGVIADARDHRDGKRSARTSVNASRTSFQSQVQGNGYTNGAPQIPASVGEEHEGSDDGMEDETLDDEYMDRWRMNRLKQLQGSRVGSSGKERRAAQGRYGSIVPVDGEGYLEAVDGSGSVTVVVVYIYDDMVSTFSSSLS